MLLYLLHLEHYLLKLQLFKCHHRHRSQFQLHMNKIISYRTIPNQSPVKVRPVMEMVFNQIDRIHLIQCIVQHPMNHRIAVTVDMSKVFHVRFFFLHVLIIRIACFVLLIMIDYYKLNRLYKALAIQKLSHPMGKATHNSPVTHHQRRLPTPHHHQAQHQHYQQHQQANHHYHNNTTATNNNTNAIPSSNLLSSSPPTPTPMNIDQFPPFYAQQSSFLPMPTTVPDSRKSKY